MALSRMVGIERGRCPPLFLGMYTRRKGRGRYPRWVSVWVAAAFCSGVFQMAPSTPGVRLPVFSVTRLTARAFPLNEWESQTLQGFHPAPSTFLSSLRDTGLEPTNSTFSLTPVDLVPGYGPVGGRTNGGIWDDCPSRFRRHLLYLLSRLLKRSRAERPEGSLLAFA